jgi:hypothetical protein
MPLLSAPKAPSRGCRTWWYTGRPRDSANLWGHVTQSDESHRKDYTVGGVHALFVLA